MTRNQALAALQSAKLYAILDTGYRDPEDWPGLAVELIRGGVGILQVRAKQSTPEEIIPWVLHLLPVTQSAGIPLIINDHPQLVPLTGAEGCHIGQDDGSVAEARRLAGTSAIVGKSTHSIEQALATAAEAPDYIGFGPIFPTPTKPDYIPVGSGLIGKMTESISIPAFCIGGIKKENARAVVAAGARRLVIVSGLLQSPDPAQYAREVIASIASGGV
jgi:thiamine-phosphate pyrophosphorylase